MNGIDLKEALHDWASEAPAARAPIDDLIERGVRRRRRRTVARVATPLAAVVAVGALLVGGVFAPRTSSNPIAAPSQAAPVDPRLELAAVVTATTGESFRFSSKTELTVPVHGIRSRGTCAGMIDPPARTGYVKEGDLVEHWAVNGRRYLREGNRHYNLGPGDVGKFIGCAGGMSADPLDLVRQLGAVSAVRKTTDGDTSTYFFADSGLRGSVTVTGGRVHSVTTSTDTPASADTPRHQFKVTMTLSGYGEPVVVKAPW
jgi:hypothetical protein